MTCFSTHRLRFVLSNRNLLYIYSKITPNGRRPLTGAILRSYGVYRYQHFSGHTSTKRCLFHHSQILRIGLTSCGRCGLNSCCTTLPRLPPIFEDVIFRISPFPVIPSLFSFRPPSGWCLTHLHQQQYASGKVVRQPNISKQVRDLVSGKYAEPPHCLIDYIVNPSSPPLEVGGNIECAAGILQIFSCSSYHIATNITSTESSQSWPEQLKRQRHLSTG